MKCGKLMELITEKGNVIDCRRKQVESLVLYVLIVMKWSIVSVVLVVLAVSTVLILRKKEIKFLLINGLIIDKNLTTVIPYID